MKLEEAILVTVIKEIFKYPRHLDPYGQVNYYLELSSDYLNYYLRLPETLTSKTIHLG